MFLLDDYGDGSWIKTGFEFAQNYPFTWSWIHGGQYIILHKSMHIDNNALTQDWREIY